MAERILALETSGSVGSVALGVWSGRTGDEVEVVTRDFLGDRGSHAREVVPAIGRLLDSARWERESLGRIVVGSGPGSFTGVRVGAAVGKGLASALGRPLHAISSLLAGAWTESAFPDGEEGERARTSSDHRWILFDARGGRLFAACYRWGEGRPIPVREPAFTTVEAVLAEEELAHAWVAGEGAVRNAADFDRAGRRVLPPPFGFPSADGLLRAFAADGGGGPVDLSSWEPDYLRASNAERGREG